MDKRLSILVCSLTSRHLLRNRLLFNLNSQMNPNIEVLVEIDDGQVTTGEKRNLLLSKAKGEYIAFIDDDDLISSNYIDLVLKSTKSNPDCVGIEGLITSYNKGWTRKFIHSMKYKDWFTKDDVYYRCPNHLSPVRKELAIKTGFKNIKVGEDKDYSLRLRPLLKTEMYIDNPIYYYLTV